MTLTDFIEECREAADRLGRHRQDHGWREIYRLLAHALRERPEMLRPILEGYCQQRVPGGTSHAITVLAIALRQIAPGMSEAFNSHQGKISERLDALDRVLQQHRNEVLKVLISRNNSFTNARRYLVPQVLMAAYFAVESEDTVRFADLGTGLGIMPRQLNVKQVYERFVAGLKWYDGTPRFVTIPLAERYGVDKAPLPDLNWVRTCYGKSPYYESMWAELLEVSNFPEVREADVSYCAVDIEDSAALGSFLRSRQINAVNLCYVLYELSPVSRREVLDTVMSELTYPGIVVITEPHADLTQQGCDVSVIVEPVGSYHVCDVTDGHFVGAVTRGPDYESFVRRFPIYYNNNGEDASP